MCLDHLRKDIGSPYQKTDSWSSWVAPVRGDLADNCELVIQVMEELGVEPDSLSRTCDDVTFYFYNKYSILSVKISEKNIIISYSNPLEVSSVRTLDRDTVKKWIKYLGKRL